MGQQQTARVVGSGPAPVHFKQNNNNNKETDLTVNKIVLSRETVRERVRKRQNVRVRVRKHPEPCPEENKNIKRISE